MSKNFLDIIVIGNDLEALAARTSAEWWGLLRELSLSVNRRIW